MRRHPPHFAATLLLILGVACEPDLPTASRMTASSAASSDRSPSVRFRLVLTGNANPDFSQGPCNVTNTESGTGIAEHMGKVTWSSTEVANFCVDPSDPATALVTGTMIVTAANGDLVTQSYTTTVNADFGAGTLTATGNYVVTGGTGRFTGATGGGTVDVTGSLAPPFGVSGTFAGTIAY
ncbi:MAG TPA: hypothetical protein VF034_04370 [Gemmatimonadaceae bacterium]|jgi:hypothetical protein